MTGLGPTTGDEPTGDRSTRDRPAALRLARLHLRTGSLGLARAELESLAGAGELDDEALLDLAEVRWRTDDLTGAGEAAAAYLASGRIALIALVVAAEATAALGRPGEARRLAGKALELADGSIDRVFAGMPRSDVWPIGQAERTAAVTATVPSREAVPVPMATSAPSAGSADLPDPAAELAAARAALAAGDRAGAAIRLAVVLRLAPALAPAVLHLAAAEPGREFDLIRGDALRLVGRESQARRAFAAAAREGTFASEAGPSEADAVGRGDVPGAEASPGGESATPDDGRSEPDH